MNDVRDAERSIRDAERIETVVIGGGQAGLSVGYHLSKRGLPFVILDAQQRVGDAWRARWDSLRLFTPARFSGLAGMPFPAHPRHFPTKDEMGDYLESYAKHFALPVTTGLRVDRVSRHGDGYVVVAGERRWLADNVVVAMGSFQRPWVPPYAADLAPGITQIHSYDYRNPSQLRDGPVLVVGAGNSGAEIALDAARAGHQTWLAGRDNGHIPFRIEGAVGRVLVRVVLRGIFHRLLTVDTPVGRRARPKMLSRGGPLVRTRPKEITVAGISRLPKVTSVVDGLPVLADGRSMQVANVVWCTGFRPGLDWIDLPVHGDREPNHDRGLVPDHPGLFFVGLSFLYAMSSEQIHGVGRDAERIVNAVAERSPQLPDAVESLSPRRSP
jgi:putative flavoprotein involved in K+ transport